MTLLLVMRRRDGRDVLLEASPPAPSDADRKARLVMAERAVERMDAAREDHLPGLLLERRPGRRNAGR